MMHGMDWRVCPGQQGWTSTYFLPGAAAAAGGIFLRELYMHGEAAATARTTV
jgi:hypothetical protein